VLHRNPAAMTATRAIFYTIFWVVWAAAFCAGVAMYYSPASAYMWWSGYLLGWMLSFDNLFVFHLVFNSYACPDHLKHRPLFFGILGAVLMRLVFIFIGEYLMHAMSFMHIIFGAFLIYTGITTAWSDEDEEDPSQQPIVLWLQSYVKLVSAYDSKGAFFVRCPVNANGEPQIPQDCVVTDFSPEKAEKSIAQEAENARSIEQGVAPPSPKYTPREFASSPGSAKRGKVDVVDFDRVVRQAPRGQVFECRATMLFLVCICLNLCDLLFAVDSVSAIVAAVDDLYLAYTSAVFAMLGMRAIFFLITIMVHLFSLLKYGVAFILVFIGVKLIVGNYYHISSLIVCGVLICSLGASVVASIINDKMSEEDDDDIEVNKPLLQKPSPEAKEAYFANVDHEAAARRATK